jgi:DNA-binding transcriptional LysR family regulator
VTGTVRIGGFRSFLTTILSPALPDWRERHPGLRIETVEAEEDELLRALGAGLLDGIAVELDAATDTGAPRGTNDTPFLDEPWKLVVPSGALLNADVVDFGRMALPVLDVPGLGLRRIVLRTLKRGGRTVLDTALSLIREAAASFTYEPSGDE